jgi:lipopolysaccharide heptosyltransferase II
VFDDLQIDDARERVLVGCADRLLRVGAALSRIRRRPAEVACPRRILVLRLERIGDLLMTLEALSLMRRRALGARIDLVVGSWNAPLARRLSAIDVVETLDAPWLARGHRGARVRDMVRQARAWRSRRYDLAVNFEPDIRSNLLLALSGARCRVGFRSRGGGALLTRADHYDPRIHTSENARRLVELALPAPDGSGAGEPAPVVGLDLPDDARARAAARVAGLPPGQPLVGIHPSGGRRVKQWDAVRFAEVAVRLARDHQAAILLTGSAEDRPIVEAVRARLPADVAAIDLAGALDVVELAALMERLSVFVSGDTGPMHLAAAVGTPVVAIFGPSDPARWGPGASTARVVRSSWWCSPCNRIRRPPARCRGRTPDCLLAIDPEEVVRAAGEILETGRPGATDVAAGL